MSARLTLLVVYELFVERTAHALGDTAVDLALDDEGIDHPAGVAHDRVIDDRDPSGLAFDLDDRDVDAAGKGGARCREVVCRLETGFHALGQG